MTRSIFATWRFVPLLAVLGAVPLSPCAANPDDTTAAALAVVDAHLANLDSFEQFTCRYPKTTGRADTVADALAGRFTNEFGPPRTAQIFWARDGHKHSIKITADELSTKEVAAPPKKTPVPGQPNLSMGTPVPFITSEALFNRTETFHYDPQTSAANMWGKGEPHSESHFLFGCHRADGCMDPLRHLRTRLDRGEASCAVTREREGERELVHLSVKYTNGLLEDYWFAPDRNYSLVRSVWKNYPNDRHGNVYRAEWPDPRPCARNRWFPGRRVELWQQKHRPDWRVWDYRVTELEVDKSPAREAFEIALPPRVVVLAFGRPTDNFITKQPEKVHVDDLPRLWAMIHKKAEEPLMDTAIHPEESYRWAWWSGAGVLAVGLLGTAGWRVRRRRADGAAA